MRHLLFIFALALVACGEHVGASPSAIVGGDADTTTSGVVMLYIDGTDSWGLCTATVVSPHVLVTAAHCVDPKNPPPVGGTPKYSVYLGDDFSKSTPADLHPVQTAAVDPAYDFSTLGAKGHDVGVVVTEDALDVTAIPFVRTPLDQSIVGSTVRLVGYGQTNPANSDSSGVRESGTTTIAKLDTAQITTVDSLPSGCNGDSGGAVLAMLDGKETLVAAISHGDLTANCSKSSTTERVDIEADFIQSFVDQYDPPPPAPDAGDTTPSDPSSSCAMSSAPSNASALAWLLAIVGLALVSRRTSASCRR